MEGSSALGWQKVGLTLQRKLFLLWCSSVAVTRGPVRFTEHGEDDAVFCVGFCFCSCSSVFWWLSGRMIRIRQRNCRWPGNGKARALQDQRRSLHSLGWGHRWGNFFRSRFSGSALNSMCEEGRKKNWNKLSNIGRTLTGTLKSPLWFPCGSASQVQLYYPFLSYGQKSQWKVPGF